MSSNNNALLCPGCRKLVSRNAPACPYCGLKSPGSRLKDNIFTRESGLRDIIKLVIISNVVMFVISVLVDINASLLSSSPFNFLSPTNNSLLVLGSTGTVPLFHLDRWWTLISASFLHGSLLHIVFNMIAIYQLGPLVIREFGPRRFIIIYTLSGIGGYLVSSVMGVNFTIGASASVCGLLGAMLYYGKHRGGTYGQAIFSQLGGWALSIGMFGFLVPGINNWGHGGGIVAGVLVAMLLGYKERKKENSFDTGLAALCIVVTLIVLVWSCFNGFLYFMSR